MPGSDPVAHLKERAEDVGAGEGQQDEGEEGGEPAVEHGRSCSHAINHYICIICRLLHFFFIIIRYQDGISPDSVANNKIL